MQESGDGTEIETTLSNGDEWELRETSQSAVRVKKVAIAGVLASLSISASPVVAVIPRLPWGMAFFDPVSLFWITAFLIGGLEVGLVCTIAGGLGLLFFDPTGIGPMFKMLATLPLIVIPWFSLKYLSKKEDGGLLAKPMTYVSLMSIAYLTRLSIMIPLNLIVVPLLWPFLDWSGLDIIVFTFTLNTLQSFMDALLPYLVVHPTTLFRHFRLW